MKLQAIKNKLIVKLGGFTKQEVLQIVPPERKEPVKVITLAAKVSINTSHLNKDFDREKAINYIKDDVLYKLADNELRSKVEFKVIDDNFNELTVIGRIEVVNRRTK